MDILTCTLGTYLRTYAIERLVNSFLTAYDVDSSEATCQIISLGAGTDTRFFRIASGEYRSNFDNNPFRKYPCNYHEIDMPENNAKKIRTIIDRYELISRIPGRVQVNENGTGLRSPTYCIHSYDLRSLRPLLPSESPKSHPLCSEPHGIDRTLPTLLISECCLVYLDSLRSTSALLFFTNLFAKEIPLSLIIYEPIKPFDPFGVTMERNLSLRGITLPGLKEFPSLEKQKDRLSNLFRNGERWASKAIDFNMIWRFWLDRYEKQRIEWLEMLDEVEEWETMAEHYCIAWGWRGGNKIDWQEWRSLPAGVVEGMPSGEALDSTPEEWTE